MKHGRSLNLDHPQYAEGARIGNQILDLGDGRHAQDWLDLVEPLTLAAHKREDINGYHLALGFIHTIREYLEGQAD